MVAMIIPNGEQTFFDDNGDPLALGTVEMFVPGTTRYKVTWTDYRQTVQNSPIITLDIAGRAVIYGIGSYRQIVKDVLGNTIWDKVVNAGSFNDSAVTPQQYGAYADGTAHPIDQDDIDNHPEWIGTYTVGTAWDYVAIMESQYACFASTSTVGNVIWHSQNSLEYLNKKWCIPTGRYYVDNQILTVASKGWIEFESRAAVFFWHGDSNTIMWECDSISYMQIDNPSLATSQVQYAALWSIDWTGVRTGQLKPQQLTINNMYLFGGLTADYGLSIATVGGSAAQCDTFDFSNSLVVGFLTAGVYGGGNNTLGLVFECGDLQSCPKWGIKLHGQYFVHGMSAQNEDPAIGTSSPTQNQIVNGGADFAGSNVQGILSSLISVRSESDVVARGYNGSIPFEAKNLGVNCSSVFAWVAGYAYIPGNLVIGNSGRVFMMVGDTLARAFETPTSCTSSTITKSGAGWGVNAYANYWVIFRYSNSFVEKKKILSNTSDTLTLDGTLLVSSLSVPGIQFRITGSSHATTEPTWSGASNGHSIVEGDVAQGFTTTVGSTTLTFGSAVDTAISANDWVMVVGAQSQGPSLTGIRNYTTALFAKVGAPSGAGPFVATMDRNADIAVTDAMGYWGTPILDNNIYWIELDFDAINGCSRLETPWMNYGRIGKTGNIVDCKGALRTDFDRTDQSTVFGVTHRRGPISDTTQALTSASTISLSASILAGQVATLTPASAITVNFPTPVTGMSQEFSLIITSSGTTPYVVTFNTNAVSSGVYNTGGTTAKSCIITFRSVPALGVWMETSRSLVSGTWTPVFTPATPGDFAATWSTQVGSYMYENGYCLVDFNLASSAFSYTTGSGVVTIAGLPYPSIATRIYRGVLDWQGITKANYTQINLDVQATTSVIRLLANGSAQAIAGPVLADFPTGGSVVLRGSIRYKV